MIVFDLDGTLADCEHRRHFVDPEFDCKMDLGKEFIFDPNKIDMNSLDKQGGFLKNKNVKGWKPDWKSFYEACDKDTPIYPVREILWSLDPYKNKIEIWSGRCESIREKTEEWLIDQIFLGNFITMEQLKLKMRPIGDNTPDDELKERWLNERCADLITAQIEGRNPVKHDIDFVFYDRPKVVRMWRRRGIFVFDCNQTGKEF